MAEIRLFTEQTAIEAQFKKMLYEKRHKVEVLDDGNGLFTVKVTYSDAPVLAQPAAAEAAPPPRPPAPSHDNFGEPDDMPFIAPVERPSIAPEERPFRDKLEENDFADAGPTKPAPKPK